MDGHFRSILTGQRQLNGHILYCFLPIANAVFVKLLTFLI